MSAPSKPKRVRGPQEKKKLSYERDRVNVYGQNDKASRKRIPKFKAASNRALRHKGRLLTALVTQADDSERAEGSLADHRTTKALHEGNHRRRKVRGFPLGFVLDERPLRRIADADRAPSRNVRESFRSALERLSSWESTHGQKVQLGKRKRP
jgi:hypothetical protein